MITMQKINALGEDQVLECVNEHSGDTLRVVVFHTSPSHYEAVSEFNLCGAKVHHPCSGPMTADLLLKWLDTLLSKWQAGQTLPWVKHPLDEKTQKFIQQTRQVGKVVS